MLLFCQGVSGRRNMLLIVLLNAYYKVTHCPFLSLSSSRYRTKCLQMNLLTAIGNYIFLFFSSQVLNLSLR